MAASSTVEKTAPEPLFLVQEFVNTIHFDPGEPTEEFLPDAEALRAWLAERGLMETDEDVTEGDLRRALDVREGLRSLLLANNGLPLD
jgi:hypothetical protein